MNELQFSIHGLSMDQSEMIHQGIEEFGLEEHRAAWNEKSLGFLTTVITGISGTLAFYNFLKWLAKRCRAKITIRNEKLGVDAEFEFDATKEDQKAIILKAGKVELSLLPMPKDDTSKPKPKIRYGTK
jgi:hypothetical protein